MNKNKLLILIILFLLPISIIGFLVRTKLNTTNNYYEITDLKFNEVIQNNKKIYSNINIKVKVNNKIAEMNLEEYLIGVIAGEMPASFETEALKAQAIASRTYAMYKINHATGEYDVIDTINDQVYLTQDKMKNKWGKNFDEYYQKIYDVIYDTQGLVLKQNNEIIKAFFFSMSNGYTEDSLTVFKEGNISSVESKWDNESLENFEVKTKFTIQELQEKLNLTDNINIEIISRSNTNRVTIVKVNNKEYTGIEFRKLLTLRSTDFDILKINDGYIITTRGNGHGVGMSQYGANGMAKEGYKYDEILKYYYQDSEISTL